MGTSGLYCICVFLLSTFFFARTFGLGACAGGSAGGREAALANASVVDSCCSTIGLGTSCLLSADVILLALDSAIAAAVAVESRRSEPATDIN